MSQNSLALIQVLKGQLKQHKINYAELAIRLNLSESSVKRLFSQGNMSLQRFFEICKVIDLELDDLVKLLNMESKQLKELSIAQERLIVSDLKLLLTTVCACNHWSFEQIIATYQFEQAELVSCLLKLETIELLQLKPGNKISLTISPNFKWRKNGPIQCYFEQQIQANFLKSSFNQVGELRIMLTGMLSKNSNQIIQQKLQKLTAEFNQLAKQDRLLDMSKRHGTSCLLAIRPWELPHFVELRRDSAEKPFL